MTIVKFNGEKIVSLVGIGADNAPPVAISPVSLAIVSGIDQIILHARLKILNKLKRLTIYSLRLLLA